MMKRLWRMADRGMRRRAIAMGLWIAWPLLFGMLRAWLELPEWSVWIQLGVPAAGAWLTGKRLRSGQGGA